MPYFRKFEKGFYDLTGDGNEKIVTDLMTRVKVREKVINEISLYDKYDVPSGERPEDTAFNISDATCCSTCPTRVVTKLSLVFFKILLKISKNFFPKKERDNQPMKVIINNAINISTPGISNGR